MSDFQVRRATLDDLKAIQDLNHDLFIFEHDWDPRANPNWPYETAGENYFRKRIEDGDGLCVVAVAATTIVGYLAAEIRREAYNVNVRAELENMTVSAEHRHRGVGRALVEAMFAWGNEHDVDQFHTAALAPNANAIAFYRAVGFINFATYLQTPPRMSLTSS